MLRQRGQQTSRLRRYVGIFSVDFRAMQSPSRANRPDNREAATTAIATYHACKIRWEWAQEETLRILMLGMGFTQSDGEPSPPLEGRCDMLRSQVGCSVSRFGADKRELIPAKEAEA